MGGLCSCCRGVGAALVGGGYPKRREKSPKLLRLMERWKIKRFELNWLYGRFRMVDANGSDKIEHDEFFSWLDEPYTHLHETLYDLIVRSGNDDPLMFDDWIVCVFGFCLATEEEILEQLFYAFDIGRKGVLNLREVTSLLTALHAENPIFPREIVETLTQSVLHKGHLDFDDFVRAHGMFPILVYPVLHVQQKMRTKVLTERYFAQLDERTDDIHMLSRYDLARKKLWATRRAQCLLYCCGWSCCGEPVERFKIEAEMDEEELAVLGQERYVNPKFVKRRFKMEIYNRNRERVLEEADGAESDLTDPEAEEYQDAPVVR